MNKIVLSIILLMMTTLAFGQQVKKSVVNLISSEKSEGLHRDGKNIIKVYKGVFVQDNSRLSSDSAYFYPSQNAFDAFGNVNINQGDTLNIYSDKLNYNGNTKTALLTDHVRLVDKDATLTTNYLTYNTATRYGTYTGGGKLVNKTNTLTSKNGYYYAFSHDSYFRYNVTLLTNDALVKTDTLRYNTSTRISYFYGPTNIYSTSGKPGARDTLYTENGLYNTVTEQAYFGKKNLYHQGTKSLKGDSLFYDRLKGYGRAVKNITFNDSEQKMMLKGDLGTFYKADERTQVTQNAYAVILTEQSDTTKTDSSKIKGDLKKDSVKNKTAAANAKKLGLKTGTDTTLNSKTPAATIKRLGLDKANQQAFKKADSLLVKGTDSLKRSGIKPLASPPGKLAKQKDKADKKISKNDTLHASLKDSVKAPGPKMKVDSVFISADTLETRILTYKDQLALQAQMKAAGAAKRDTSIKVKKVVKKPGPPSKFLSYNTPQLNFDRVDYQPQFFGKPKVPAPKPKRQLSAAEKKRFQADSIRRSHIIDSVGLVTKIKLDDTTRVRILYGYHNAKLFKSDLQSKSDSIFYSSSDSTIQCFVNPIIWTQGSQLSGDTVYLQMKNKKLDNLVMAPSAFIVNLTKGDSIHFNQVGGKKLRGFFKNDKLNRVFVDGNAEDIYFQHDSLGVTTDLIRSISSRIRVNFKENETQNVTYITKTEHRDIPMVKVKEEDKILKNFIWKPKERPVSKEAVIHAAKYRAIADKAAAKNKPLAAKDSTSAKPGGLKLQAGTTKKDSVASGKPVLKPAGSEVEIGKSGRPLLKVDSALGKRPLLIRPDSSKKPLPGIKFDSAALKKQAVTKSDSTKKN